MESTMVFMSPPRINGYVVTSKLGITSPPPTSKKGGSYYENFSENETPSQKISSPQVYQTPLEQYPFPSPLTPLSGDGGKLSRRGRPRAEVLPILSMEGDQHPENSDIKCKICKRIFPREKSLHAHLRTHTGMASWLRHNRSTFV